MTAPMDFVRNNLLLFVVAFVSGAMLLWPWMQRLTIGGKDVSVQEAVQLINRRDAVILDVRNAADYAAGHIPNARHVPAGEIMLDQRRDRTVRNKRRQHLHR